MIATCVFSLKLGQVFAARYSFYDLSPGIDSVGFGYTPRSIFIRSLILKEKVVGSAEEKKFFPK
jgi:hypothetical protein